MAKKAKKVLPKKKTRFDAKRKGAGKPKVEKPKPKPGPRSVALPGMAKVRDQKLDNICEAIGEERQRINKAKQEETGLITGALQQMQRKALSVYRHAGVELARVPGAEKLRVRLTKEQGDADESDLEPGDSPSDEEEAADAARPETAFGEDGE